MTTQISLSFELISLLSWLMKHEKNMLNSLVKHALDHGFAEQFDQLDASQFKGTQEELYNTVLSFLEFLESSLIKNLEVVQVDPQTKDSIMPTLQKIEGDSLDQKTLWLSMRQTKARIMKDAQKGASPEEQLPVKKTDSQKAAEILFEQIIKNWKPNNKEVMN